MARPETGRPPGSTAATGEGPDASPAGGEPGPAVQPGGERGSGRPSGVPGDARPAAEGRPVEVRYAQPRRLPASQQPTEGAVDRGQTPSTEHDPGQDL